MELPDHIRRLVVLEDFGAGRFRGIPLDPSRFRLFGGQPMAQSMIAAQQTVSPEHRIHSLHAYFVRAGDAAVPIDYTVHALRDGRSFSTRRIEAAQNGQVIFEMLTSFQPLEQGLEHQVTMPADVPGPEETQPDKGRTPVSDDVQITDLGLELRTVGGVDPIGDPVAPENCPARVWIRTRDRLPDDHIVHAAILGYVSDMTLLGSAGAPQGMTLSDPSLQCASLDHALWFHRDFRIDEWILHDVLCPSLSSSRALTQGRVFRRDGALVATTAQEGLVRRLTKATG